MMRMRKRFQWKRAAVAVLAVGVCLCITAGCGNGMQTTEEVVVEKPQDGGRMPGQAQAGEGAAAGNVAEQVQAPERYRAEASSDTVRIVADAVVTIPDVPGIKLKKVTGRVFTQEDYDAVSRALLGGAKLWDRDYEAMKESHGFFREELDERIAQLEKSIARDGADGDAPYAGKDITLNRQLEEFKALREEAVSAAEAASNGWIKEIPAIVTYDEALSESNGNVLYGKATAGGGDYFVQVENNPTKEFNTVSFLIVKEDGSGNYSSFSDSLPDPENMENVTLDPEFKNMDTPPEEILKKAEEAMKQMGLDGYSIQDGMYFACWSANEAIPDSPTYLDRIGYGVNIVRVVDGIPVTHTLQNGGNGNDEGTVSFWPFEEMQLVYNSDGFHDFRWEHPYTVEALSEEYVFLLPFSDIGNIFEEMALKLAAEPFNGEGDTVDIRVDEAVLSYMRIKEKGSMEGTLVPVWDFFGSKTITNAAGEAYYKNGVYESLLTINAMDGTIVDRWMGY